MPLWCYAFLPCIFPSFLSHKTAGANAAAGRPRPRGQRQTSNLSQETDHGVPPQFRPFFRLDAHDADGCRDGEGRGALRGRARQLLGPRGKRRPHERPAAAGAVIFAFILFCGDACQSVSAWILGVSGVERVVFDYFKGRFEVSLGGCNWFCEPRSYLLPS